MSGERAPIRYVYIAGPYSSDPVAGVRAAIEAGNRLMAEGFVPYVPHLCHLWHLVTPRAYDGWIALGFAWLERCDAVLRLPGESRGADAEVAHAINVGVPTFHSIDSLVRAAHPRPT